MGKSESGRLPSPTQGEISTFVYSLDEWVRSELWLTGGLRHGS